MAAIPNMRVYLPSDRFQTAKLVEALLTDEKPAYIRVGRNAVADIYSEENTPFEMDKATALSEGTDVLLVACGEMVRPALDAAAMLKEEGISAGLLDMYCVKPLDKEGLVEAAKKAKVVISIEEHAPFGGLGSMVSQVVGAECARKVVNMSLPDAPVITGTSKEVFDYYGLNAEGIAKNERITGLTRNGISGECDSPQGTVNCRRSAYAMFLRARAEENPGTQELFLYN